MANHQLSNKEETEMLEQVLTAATAERFRNFVCEELPLSPGDSVLSVGCGPGFETAVLGQQVKEGGRVTGIDVNKGVLAAARDRCGDLPQVSFQQGDLTDLPVTEGSYDCAVAKQVLQFVSNVEAALDELYRVLKPDGSMAVVEGDKDTRVVHSSDPERMRRANEVYLAAMDNRHLGTRLISLLSEAGFTVEDVVPRARVQREINDQVERGIEVQRGFLESGDEFDASEIEAWEQDLKELDNNGQFLACSTTFLYIARKPE